MKIRFFSVFLAILILSICCRVSAARTEWKNAPSVSAQSAYVIEADRLETVFEKNADLRLPMASTTKIMTALVAIENCDTESIVKVPSEAVGIEGSSAYLRENDSVKMIDLLYSVMLESANDSAAALAVTVGGSIEGFADLMNEKAKNLGLQNTHFTNPHGLDDPEHYTTARDLAKLTVAALNNDAFLKIVSTYSAELFTDSDGIARRAINHNKLLKSLDGAIGVKTGFTKKSG